MKALVDEICQDNSCTGDCIHVISGIVPRMGARGALLFEQTQSVPLFCLWSILKWEKKLGLHALESLGVNLDEIEREVDHAIEFRLSHELADIASENVSVLDEAATRKPLESEIRFLVERARNEATLLHHDWIGTEHLLLALCDSDDVDVSRLFESHQIDRQKLARAIVGMLKK